MSLHTTPPLGSGPTGPDPMRRTTAWHADPLEVDRWLDGEGSPAEREARARDLVRDPALAARVEARKAFLGLLATGRSPSPQDAVAEARLREALAREASSPAPARMRLLRRWQGWAAAAAVLLVALGAWSGWGLSRAIAVETPAEMAVRLLDWIPSGSEGVAGCAEAGPSPQTFVLVQDGELEIRACEEGTEGQDLSRALLRRPEELPAVGFVAVPAPGARRSSEIGITEMGKDGVVVFDVLDHGKRVYLAVDAASLRQRHPGKGDAWTCAACHGTARQAMDNPHRIVLRRLR